MLQDDYEEDVDLADFQRKIKEYFPEEFQQFYSEGENLWRFDYPYGKPEKISSFTLDKKPEFTGRLTGIKGQYLCFDGNQFMNVRGHEGYVVALNVKN